MPKVKDQLEDLGIDGKAILKLFSEEQSKEVWYKVTRDRIPRLSSVGTVMDIRVPQESDNFSNK